MSRRMPVAYDAGTNLDALRERLATAGAEEIEKFLPIARRQVEQALRIDSEGRAAYWTEAARLATDALAERAKEVTT